MYPITAHAPNGKLRLVYECNPMAYIVEQAGGKASNGYERILELEVTELHQRSAIMIGSTSMVEKAEEMLACFSPQVTKRNFDGVVTIQ